MSPIAPAARTPVLAVACACVGSAALVLLATGQLGWIVPVVALAVGLVLGRALGPARRRPRRPESVLDHDDLLQTIVEHIPCGVFWKDRRSVYLGCNAQVARDAGQRSSADLVGKTDRDLSYRPDEAEFYRACDRQVMEGGAPLLNVEEPQTRPTARPPCS